MRIRNLLSSAAALLAATASSSAIAQEVPVIYAGSNGEIEATFRSNNCVVYYNANGSRREANRNCSRDQTRRADDGVARYRREQGIVSPPVNEETGDEAPPGGFETSGQAGGPPEIIMDDHGRSHVNIGTHCTIYYGRSGNFDTSSGACTRADRRTADRAIEGFRREQGEVQGSSFGTYLGVPIYHFRNGNFQATMTDRCVVYFRESGVILSSTSSCTSTQKSRATLAVLQFKREHGIQ